MKFSRTVSIDRGRRSCLIFGVSPARVDFAELGRRADFGRGEPSMGCFARMVAVWDLFEAERFLGTDTPGFADCFPVVGDLPTDDDAFAALAPERPGEPLLEDRTIGGTVVEAEGATGPRAGRADEAPINVRTRASTKAVAFRRRSGVTNVPITFAVLICDSALARTLSTISRKSGGFEFAVIHPLPVFPIVDRCERTTAPAELAFQTQSLQRLFGLSAN